MTITVADVTYRYNGDGTDIDADAATAALNGVSLTVDDGDVLVLAGPNGSGKTTLVRLCNGLLTPDAGEVRVNGTPVDDAPVAARSSVGMVFQDPRDGFVAATVGADVAFGPENLGLAHDEIDRRVDDALAAVRMDGRATDRIDELSGGERERVAIAGALAMDPDHLVLDEPLTGLDWDARRSVLDRLDHLRDRGVSVVVVTHDLRDLAVLADRTVALADGRVALNVADPSPEALTDLGVRPP
jgi:biotin transport system ATP-binding protein